MNRRQGESIEVQPQPKRRYSSPLREEQRRATRARVVDAAGAVFSERGYVATTMQAIAEAAGVSVDTVYLTGSKRELVFAAMEKALVGDEGSHSALERPWLRELLAEPHVPRLLSLLAEAAAAGHARTAGIFSALVGGAAADEELGQAYRDLVGRMRSDTATIASLLDERRGPHQGLPLDDLGDTIFALGHFDCYHHLVEEAGWSQERYATWLEKMLTTAVLGSPTIGGPARARSKTSKPRG